MCYRSEYSTLCLDISGFLESGFSWVLKHACQIGFKKNIWEVLGITVFTVTTVNVNVRLSVFWAADSSGFPY